MHTKTNFRHIVQGAAAIAVMAAMAPAMAGEGEIQFNGKVLSTTCSVAGGGGASGNKNLTVKLPSVSMSALASEGSVAGRTPFSIILSGCSGDSTKVSTVFEAGDTVDSGTGRLNLVSSGAEGETVATNVQIGLLNDQQKPILAGLASGLQQSQVVNLNKDEAGVGGATLNYYAEYHATGKATAGSANTRVQYSMDYQ